MSGDTVRLAIEGGAASVTIERPPLNVLDLATIDRLQAALEACAAKPEVVVVILRAAGEKAFSAGVDVADHTPERVPGMLEAFHGVVRRLGSWDRVSIAAVQGLALGGGAELALACDFVAASTEAQFAFPEIDVGCFPPVAVASLPRRVGWGRAAEWVLTGRRFSAAEAHAAGLVTKVVRSEDLVGTVRAWTESLLGKSPAVLRETVRALREAARLDFETALARAEEVYKGPLLALEDCREGVAAFVERRKPRWRGR